MTLWEFRAQCAGYTAANTAPVPHRLTDEEHDDLVARYRKWMT